MYTLTGRNSFIRDSDGAIIPFDPANADYLEAVNILLPLELITIDSDGNITDSFPDGSNLKIPDLLPLADLKVLAKQHIDDAAGRARARYITVAPGQDATYIAKAQDADKYKAASYLPGNAAGFPWIQAEVQANGGQLTTTQATDGIIAQRDLWYQLGTAVEAIRIGGKLTVDAQANAAGVASTESGTIATLDGI